MFGHFPRAPSFCLGLALADFLAFRSISPVLCLQLGASHQTPRQPSPCVWQAWLGGEWKNRRKKAQVLSPHWRSARGGAGARTDTGLVEPLWLQVFFVTNPEHLLYHIHSALAKMLLMTFSESRFVLNCKHKKSCGQVRFLLWPWTVPAEKAGQPAPVTTHHVTRQFLHIHWTSLRF